jgi:hypothetical protein
VNIFVLSEDPKEAVISLGDRHVVKMVLETAQILSSASHLNGKTIGYKPTHLHHPCVKWAAETLHNFLWLAEYGVYLAEEYHHRYNKTHKSKQVIWNLAKNGNIAIKLDKTPFAQAMPEQYKQEDAVKAYREYYMAEKFHLFQWTNREMPDWIAKWNC